MGLISNTRSCSRVTVALLGFMMALTSVPLSRAQAQSGATPQAPSADLAQRVQDLETELKDLRSELAAMKQQHGPRAIAEVASTTMPTLPASAPEPLVQEAPPAAAAPAPAPEKISLAGLLGPTTLSGFVDGYYSYNSNQPANRINQYHNFEINSGQFGLNMIELVADKAPDPAASRLGFHIALGFGQAMNQVNATEIGPGGTELNFDQYLKEGYLEYLAPVGKGLQINFGKFVTPAGAEVIESKDNWNYSRGLLFAWAIPYFHFGLSAKYAFNDKYALTAYLVNGWNNSVDNNSGKTTGFSFAWTPNKKVSLIENYLVGPEASNFNGTFRHLSDTVLTYSPTAKLSLMANYDYGQDHFVDTSVLPPITGPMAHWSGIAGYIKYAFNDKWTVATRGEYFDDHDGFATGATQHLSEFTATLQRTIAKNLITRLEFRRDMSNQDTFPYRTGLFNDSQNTVTVGMIYAFSSSDAK
jgi:hypothetical protein